METRRVALPPINLNTLHGFIGRMTRERRRLPFLLTGLALKLAPIESPAQFLMVLQDPSMSSCLKEGGDGSKPQECKPPGPSCRSGPLVDHT